MSTKLNYTAILKRAWEITGNYRALWLPGIFLALAKAGTGFHINPNFSSGGHGQPFPPNVRRFLPPITRETTTILTVIALSLLCLAAILFIGLTIAKYVSLTSLIKAVDEHENTNSIHTWKKVLRIGRSQEAYRLFLMELLIALPFGVLAIIIFIIALLPMLGWTTDDPTIGIIGTFISIGLLLPAGLILFAISIAISIFLPLARRVCVLERRGAVESLTMGFRLIKAHLGDVLITWLILLGIRLLWGLVTLVVLMLLLPVGAFLGGPPALIAGGLATLLTNGATPWIVAGVVGLPLFALTVILPLTFLQALPEVFNSTTWTLTYHELTRL